MIELKAVQLRKQYTHRRFFSELSLNIVQVYLELPVLMAVENPPYSDALLFYKVLTQEKYTGAEKIKK